MKMESSNVNGYDGLNGAAKGSERQLEEVERECARALKEFRRVFGSDAEPEFGSYAPGRVNLMGGSIDYSGGPVIPVVRTERRCCIKAVHNNNITHTIFVSRHCSWSQ